MQWTDDRRPNWQTPSNPIHNGLTGILDKPYRMISSCSSHVDTLLPCICCFAFCTVNSPFPPTHTTAWVSDNTGNVCKWANIYLERPGRKTMPATKCPIDGCEYTTDDVEATIAAALLNCHASKHVPPVAPLATHQYRPSAWTPPDWHRIIWISVGALPGWVGHVQASGWNLWTRYYYGAPRHMLHYTPSLPIWIYGKRHARICRWGRPIKPHQEHICEG